MGEFVNELLAKFMNTILESAESALTTFEKTVFYMVDWLSGQLVGLFSTSLDWFNSAFPIVDELDSVIIYMAVSLTVLMMVWQLFRSMGGNIVGDAEEPWLIVTRSLLFLFLVFFIHPISNIVLTYATTFFDAMGTVTNNDSAFSALSEMGLHVFDSGEDGLRELLGAEESESGSFWAAIWGGVMNILLFLASFVMMLLLTVPIVWNYFKLIIETAERYVTMCLLYYMGPLAMSMGASKATNNITKSWARMFGSSMLLMVLNVWCLKMFASAIANAPATITISGFNVFGYFITLYAFLKVAQHLDEYMATMGITTARTGGSMLDDIMASRRAASEAFGGGKGNNKGGGSSKGSSDGHRRRDNDNGGGSNNRNTDTTENTSEVTPTVPMSQNGSNTPSTSGSSSSAATGGDPSLGGDSERDSQDAFNSGFDATVPENQDYSGSNELFNSNDQGDSSSGAFDSEEPSNVAFSSSDSDASYGNSNSNDYSDDFSTDSVDYRSGGGSGDNYGSDYSNSEGSGGVTHVAESGAANADNNYSYNADSGFKADNSFNGATGNAPDNATVDAANHKRRVDEQIKENSGPGQSNLVDDFFGDNYSGRGDPDDTGGQ